MLGRQMGPLWPTSTPREGLDVSAAIAARVSAGNPCASPFHAPEGPKFQQRQQSNPVPKKECVRRKEGSGREWLKTLKTVSPCQRSRGPIKTSCTSSTTMWVAPSKCSLLCITFKRIPTVQNTTCVVSVTLSWKKRPRRQAFKINRPNQDNDAATNESKTWIKLQNNSKPNVLHTDIKANKKHQKHQKTHHLLKADFEGHGISQLRPPFVRHAVRHRHGRDAPRLRGHEATWLAAGSAVFQEKLWDLRGLPWYEKCF